MKPTWIVLAIWLAGLGAAGQYAKVSVVFDQLSDIYPEAGVGLGLMVSLVGFLGILFGVVAGLVVAELRPRRVLLWSLWAGAAIGLLESLMPPLALMLALRLIEGVSHLGLVVAAPTLIGGISSEARRGLAMTLWSTFFSVGFAVMVYGGIPLAKTFGIPVLFAAHAGFLALIAAMLHPVLPDVPTQGGRLTWRAVWREHLAIYKSSFVASPAIGWFFYTFCFLAILTVLPPFIRAELRAWVIGAMPLVSIAVSMTLGVWLLRFMPAIALMQVGFVLCILTLAGLLLAPGAALACFAVAAAFGIVQGAGFAAVPQLNPQPEAQAQAYGALAQMGNLGNTIGTPMLLGIVGAAGYSGLVVASMSAFVVAVFGQVWLSRRRALAIS